MTLWGWWWDFPETGTEGPRFPEVRRGVRGDSFRGPFFVLFMIFFKVRLLSWVFDRLFVEDGHVLALFGVVLIKWCMVLTRCCAMTLCRRNRKLFALDFSILHHWDINIYVWYFFQIFLFLYKSAKELIMLVI